MNSYQVAMPTTEPGHGTKMRSNTKETLVQLLRNIASPKEIDLYLKRFVDAEHTQFAVIKIGGAILQQELDSLCVSLAFLERIGLFPILVHGAGPQLNQALANENLATTFVQGQRVTTPEVLRVAKRVFIEENLRLATRLQSLGIKTASITQGVFKGEIEEQPATESLGLVGNVSELDLLPVQSAIELGAIPILSPIGENALGQSLNINADIATQALAKALKPYKIIFLTQTGGILNQDGALISSINLATDYPKLLDQAWLTGGMALKLNQIAALLEDLPERSSVSITKPDQLAKELFTHRGSGTLVKKGETIIEHQCLGSIDMPKLKALLESSFEKALSPDYFAKLKFKRAYITECYRAAAIVTNEQGLNYLDKFVVCDDAKGEGLGKALWHKLAQSNPQLFWRATPSNPINAFYYNKADGMQKTKGWHVFWLGQHDGDAIDKCIQCATGKAATLYKQEEVRYEKVV